MGRRSTTSVHGRVRHPDVLVHRRWYRPAPMPGVHEPLTDALLDPATYQADVHVVLDRLRAEAPLAWNGTKGFWAVTRHADVSEASSDPSRFCSAKGILVDEI